MGIRFSNFNKNKEKLKVKYKKVVYETKRDSGSNTKKINPILIGCFLVWVGLKLLRCAEHPEYSRQSLKCILIFFIIQFSRE